MFKIIFEFVTEFMGNITHNTLYDLILVVIISQVLYIPAYRIVGDMYNLGIIESREAGSFFHWVIRSIFFIMVVAIIGLIYQAYKFICGIF